MEQEMSITMSEEEFYRTPIKKLAQSFSLKNGKLDLIFYPLYVVKGKDTRVYTAKDIYEMELTPFNKKIIKKKGTCRDFFEEKEDIKIKDVILNYSANNDELVMVIKPKIFIGEKYHNMVCYSDQEIISLILDIDIPLSKDGIFLPSL